MQAVSTSENPFDWNMIFTLPGGETRLWWKVSKETLAAPPPKAPACLTAAPENIMPLVSGKKKKKIVFSLLPKQKYGAGRIFLKKVLDFIK